MLSIAGTITICYTVVIHFFRISLGSISAALSCPVYVPPTFLRGRSAGSFPEQLLAIDPSISHDHAKALF